MPDNHRDVGSFHCKFGLDHTDCDGDERLAESAGPRDVARELIEFRLKFLLEELKEIAEACGYSLGVTDVFAGELTLRSDEFITFHRGENQVPEPTVDHVKLFDGLLDLAYVTFGFAHVMGYPWQAGWDEVQRANITKERCGIDHVFSGEGVLCRHLVPPDDLPCGQPRSAHSLRGSAYDVIKPVGWTAPDITGLLKRHGWKL